MFTSEDQKTIESQRFNRKININLKACCKERHCATPLRHQLAPISKERHVEIQHLIPNVDILTMVDQ